jgi:predicted Zn-dependent protease
MWKGISWVWALLAGLALLAGSGCGTVPVTGRKQLNFISATQEMQLGLTSFEQMKKETPISKDPAANALVQKVGKKIASVADLPNAQWEFVVFESNEANAFCLPGGKVGVYSGILPITKTEAGLATVIGHEVAHAVARHGAERMSEETAISAVGTVLGATLSASDPKTQALVQLAYGSGTQLGRTLPHSRAQESEADHIGLIYMARAGYNPQEALEFWKRFAEVTKSSETGLWFLSTHPVTADRIKALEAEMPTAMAEYKGGTAPQTPAR